MNRLYLDIETIPAGQPDAPENFDAPSNYVKAEAILKYQQEAATKEFRKRGVVTHKSQIICICCAIDDDEVDCFYGSNEEEVVRNFYEFLTTNLPRQELQTCYIIGHNIMFDIKTIAQRIFKYRINFPELTLLNPYHVRVVDTMTLFNIGDRKELTSLNDVCKFFGIEEKGMKGSEVYDYYLLGDHDKIKEYCKEDVRKTRMVHKILIGEA